MVSADFLVTVPIFSNLEPEDLVPLAGKLRPRGYQKGEVIFHQDDQEVVAQTTSLLTSRLRSVNQMLGELAFLDVPTRMAKQLLELAQAYADDNGQNGPQNEPQNTPIEVPMGQDQLARLVGASRETISRALNSYRRLGILSTSHLRITILDLEALERMASF